MAVTLAWDETAPGGGSALQSGDDAIRAFKQSLRERLRNGGMRWGSGGPTTNVDDGKLTAGQQGTTGILNLAYSEADALICVMRDGTDGGGLKRFEVGTIAGAENYDLRVDSVTADTLSAATTLTMPSNTVHEQTFVGNTPVGGPVAGAWASIDTATPLTTKAGTAGPILIIWHGSFRFVGGAVASLDLRIRRDSTVVSTYTAIGREVDGGSVVDVTMPITLCFLDTGATAATAHTYDIQAQETGAGIVIHENVLQGFLVLELRND